MTYKEVLLARDRVYEILLKFSYDKTTPIREKLRDIFKGFGANYPFSKKIIFENDLWEVVEEWREVRVTGVWQLVMVVSTSRRMAILEYKLSDHYKVLKGGTDEN